MGNKGEEQRVGRGIFEVEWKGRFVMSEEIGCGLGRRCSGGGEINAKDGGTVE